MGSKGVPFRATISSLIVQSWSRRTHYGLEDLANGPGDGEVSPDEHGVGPTLYVGEHTCSEISSRADHVVESHEEGGPLRAIS